MATPHKPVDPIGRSLDILMLIIGIGTLAIIAYDLRVGALGKRLATDVTAWMREQTAPTAPEKKDP